ncbi:hypothetical protein RFI_18877 [Reticulomyxa filosa]|uniref:Nickel/cobalt efflux system n=1 Tax=Reticulomyxa filosa TaxID=46433 RepID=X6MWM7_RETFI|nr:hypothetical protein RFI_18877 [Reticulomyxa filosa]|eukprot:ETO18388.1 hypothetical protein RFI_18877 [Reticulomyxa filosa]
MGIIHVLAGPDHLSALSTLVVGKQWYGAFGIGVRWGCGHSFGLLVVAIIFFSVGSKFNLDSVQFWADLLVGMFMILFGGYYTRSAFIAYQQRNRLIVVKDEAEADAQEDAMTASEQTHNRVPSESVAINSNELLQSQSQLSNNDRIKNSDQKLHIATDSIDLTEDPDILALHEGFF